MATRACRALGLQLSTPGKRSRFGTLTQTRRLFAYSMLHPSRGSKRPIWLAATRTRWRKSTRKPRSRAFQSQKAACFESASARHARVASSSMTALGRVFTRGRLRAPRWSIANKTRRRLHRRSPSSIESCIFAH